MSEVRTKFDQWMGWYELAEALNRGLYIGVDAPPSNAHMRMKPSGYAYVPGNIFGCVAPGLASHDIDLEVEFERTFASDLTSTPNELTSGKFISTSGNDNNAGTFSAPYATLVKAQQQITSGSIWIKPGTYTQRFDVRNTYSTKAIKIKALDGLGSVVFRSPGQQPSEMEWIEESGTTYTATPAGSETVNHIIFLSSNGEELDLEYKTSVANVNASVNGYFQDQDTKAIYINYGGIDIEAQKSSFEIMYARGLSPVILGSKTYVQDIVFRGDDNIVATDGAQVYFKNSKFQYQGGHNLIAQGATAMFSQDCISERALNGDGFHYEQSASISPKGLEIDCVGRKNGIPVSRRFVTLSGTNNCQGSSAHPGSIVARINGEYHGNYGQNSADGDCWMVGSKFGCTSLLQTTSDNVTPSGTAYLDTVKASGRNSPFGLSVTSGITYMHHCEFSGRTAPTRIVSGEIRSY